MSSILGLLLAGAVISTAIKVGVLVVSVNAYRARHRRNEAATPADATPAPSSEHPTADSSPQN